METLSTDILAQQIAEQLKQSITIKEIREAAAIKGYHPQQIDEALNKAHDLVQQQSNKDPFVRIILGSALLLIAFVGFYADWQSRFVGFGSVIGLICLLMGGRMIWSLLKLWTRKRNS